MSFSSVWSDSHGLTPSILGQSQPTSTVALEFLFLAATSGIPYLNTFDFEYKCNILGTGAVSLVEERHYRGDAVAVKQCRIASRPLAVDEHAFDRYLKHFMLEFRILAQTHLKEHPNILRILGYGLENNGLPYASLVMECSKLGTLDVFLRTRPTTPVSTRIGLCFDIASGLEALHSLNISHGDVKATNALIFAKDQDEYTAKLCDFSQAVVAKSNDIHGRVSCSYGTPLLNAPEIRTGVAPRDTAFDIQAAKMTDIFSYGLLVWQVLQNGVLYFDNKHWVHDQDDIENKETFLNALPKDGLCTFAMEYVSQLAYLDSAAKDIFLKVFFVSLKDNPCERMDISKICDMLGPVTQGHFKRYNRKNELSLNSHAVLSTEFPLFRYSLFELLDMGLGSLTTLDTLPIEMHKRFLAELKALAQHSEPTQTDRKVAAAMMLSECYAIGFGVEMDMDSMLVWLLNAAEAGSAKAKFWYYRVKNTFQKSEKLSLPMLPQHNIEVELSKFPSQLYMSNRIRQYSRAGRDASLTARRRLEIGHGSHAIQDHGNSGVIKAKQYLDLETFVQGEIDHLGLIHWAVWLDVKGLAEFALDENQSVNETTKQGRTPLFYACLAGDLAMVMMLLRHGADASIPDAKGITPLHLCIMFEERDLDLAVHLLLQHGAELEGPVDGGIHWKAHDLDLGQFPLEWAVQTRNKHMVKILIDAGAAVRGLDLAVSSCFPEIAELLLSYKAESEAYPSSAFALGAIPRPFRHWLCHGNERLDSISRTIDVLEQNGLDIQSIPNTIRGDHITLLIFLINNARSEEDFEVIRQFIKRGINVKENSGDDDALSSAIAQQASGGKHFAELVELLTMQYCTEELNTHLSSGITYLQLAITAGSVAAARVLLENGADVNCPSTAQAGGQTPLQASLTSQERPDMLRLLLEFGADLTETDAVLGLEPLTQRLMSRQLSPLLLDFLLGHGPSKEVVIQAFQLVVHAALNMEPGCRESFRYLLCHEKAVAYVNEVDKGCFGMVHVLALRSDLEMATLSINAGVYSDCVFREGKLTATPLHVALAKGRFLWEVYASDPDAEEPSKKAQRLAAMDLADLLLTEYQNSGNGWFQDITRLHLATYMRIAKVVKALVTDGYDVNARGQWPTNGDLVTAKELLVGSKLTPPKKPGERPYLYPYYLNVSDEDEAAVMSYDYEKTVMELREQFNLSVKLLNQNPEDWKIKAIRTLQNNYEIFQLLDSHQPSMFASPKQK